MISVGSTASYASSTTSRELQPVLLMSTITDTGWPTGGRALTLSFVQPRLLNLFQPAFAFLILGGIVGRGHDRPCLSNPSNEVCKAVVAVLLIVNTTLVRLEKGWPESRDVTSARVAPTGREQPSVHLTSLRDSPLTQTLDSPHALHTALQHMCSRSGHRS